MVALPADRLVTQQLEGDLLAGDLIGRPLFDGSGHHIGEVSDILIDRNRRLSAVVVTLNAGAGSKKVGIPFDALRQDPGNRRDHRLIAQVDTAALRQAKAFEALAKEASQDDNQDLTTGRGGATGASVPPPAR